MRLQEGDWAINLIPLRQGIKVEEFAHFSAEVDQPICLGHDVVQGFDAYVVTRRDPGAPQIDIVEVMQLRSWDEWVNVRDNSPSMAPVMSAFPRMVDANAVKTIFGKRIARQ